MTEDSSTLSPIQTWWLAIRPKTLPAAAAPVAVGWGLAWQTGKIHWGAAVAALFGALMIQIGTNLVNDVVDFAKGADAEDRLGPTRVTQTGLLSEKQVWAGVWASFGLATLAGFYLWAVAGWPVVVIGLASIFAGIIYTAGPYPLAYIGLGDLFVMIFFGFVAVCGTVFVAAGQVTEAAWWAAAAVGALTVNILVVNNVRDIESDKRAGRINIPIKWGRGAGELEYVLMLGLAYLVPAALFLLKLASAWVFLPLITLPQGIKLYQTLRSGLAGPPLNPILGQTAQLLIRYSVLLGVGLALG